MWGAKPPEPPRGGRPGQSGRFPPRVDEARRFDRRASSDQVPPAPGRGASFGRMPTQSGGRGYGVGRGSGTVGNYGPSGPQRAYDPPTNTRQPRAPGLGDATHGYGPSPYPLDSQTAATLARPRLRTAMLHFGNPGHLWRGEFNSMLGETIISVGVVMWLTIATYSPKDIALALVALGLPALFAGPLAAPLTRVQEPAGLFKLFGRLRVLFALGLIGMHFLTILPVMYLLLFAISLCSRLRAALRVAAMRACLARGEPERVAASTHFAAVVVAVAGPLLATILFLLDGERLLMVAIGGATLFLLSASSDALVKALPRPRRAFLLATPEADVYAPAGQTHTSDDAETETEDEEADAQGEPDVMRRETTLPEWQQWGPGKFGEAVADISAGLGLASSTARSAAALRTLAALALVGGGISILEVFYITDHLLQPAYLLGPLLAAEGAGLALGATIWSDLGRRGAGKGALFVGTIGTGVGLAVLAVVNLVVVALPVALAMGVANALAVEGGREALRVGFDGVERRALAAAESFVVTLCALLGALLFVVFHAGLVITRPAVRHGGLPVPQALLVPFPAAQVLFGAGAGLAVAGLVLAFWLMLAVGVERAHARALVEADIRRDAHVGRRGGLARPDADDQDQSASWPAASGDWDADQDDREATDYSAEGYAVSYGADSRADWDDEADDDGDGWGSSGRGGRPAPHQPPRRGGRR